MEVVEVEIEEILFCCACKKPVVITKADVPSFSQNYYDYYFYCSECFNEGHTIRFPAVVNLSLLEDCLYVEEEKAKVIAEAIKERHYDYALAMTETYIKRLKKALQVAEQIYRWLQYQYATE